MSSGIYKEAMIKHRLFYFQASFSWFDNLARGRANRFQ
jgi:hypothetical protein